MRFGRSERPFLKIIDAAGSKRESQQRASVHD